MPPLRRRTPRRRPGAEELTADLLYHLLTGMTFFGGFGEDRRRFEEAWQLHGEEILPAFIASNPGRRPFAWWLIDHGKERPLLPGSRFTRGQLVAGNRREFKFGYLHDRSGGFQETEQSYLRRHGLFTADERRLDALGQLRETALLNPLAQLESTRPEE